VSFPIPRVFCAPAEGVTLGIGYQRRVKKNWNDGATRWSKMFEDRFNHLDTLPGVTDRRTRCRSKDRATLCVARVKGQQMKFWDSLAILLASFGHDKASKRVSCTEIDSVPDMKRRTLSTG